MIKEKQIRVHSLKNPLGTIKTVPTSEYLQSIRYGDFQHSKINVDAIRSRKRISKNHRLIAKNNKLIEKKKEKEIDGIYLKPRFGGYKIPTV